MFSLGGANNFFLEAPRMHPMFWKYAYPFFIFVLVFGGSVENIPARSPYSTLQVIRVADFVNYTHIALELSGRPSSVDFQSHKLGEYQVLTVKLQGILPGEFSKEYPVKSDILLQKIAVSHSGDTLSLTIPCHKTADLPNLVWHVWDEMVTVDVPLSVPNHARVPSIEEIKFFREKGGKIVILDAGHGGFDSGAVPRYAEKPFLREKDMTLELARILERMFAQNPRIKAFLTRYDDYLPVPFGLKGRSRDEYKRESLRYRVQLAKEYLGDAYISLHLNAPPSYHRSAHQRARGYEIYYLGETHAENLIKNPDVVDLTNLGVEDQKIGGNLSNLVLGMLKDNIPQMSMDLAGLITTEMRRIPWLEMREPSMKSQRFTVIKQLLMPSVLVECLFITHPAEHEQVRSSANRIQIASALYNGICKFLFEPSVPIQVAIDSNSIKKPAPQAAPTIPVQKETAEPIRHEVQKNETLAGIASRYGLSVEELRRLNRGKIDTGNTIHPGDILSISGKPQETILETPAPPASKQNMETYTVESGDTLEKIARDFNTTAAALRELNGFQTRSPKIFPGDTIKVPTTRTVRVVSARPQHHAVRPGDSLDKIARQYGTTVTELKRLNNYQNKNPLLHPGDKIRVR